MTRIRFVKLAFAIVLSMPGNGVAHETTSKAPAHPVGLSPAGAKAAAVVDAFHAALRAGDVAKAAELMDSSAVIFEAGGVEQSRAAYVAQHLSADAAYEKDARLTLSYRTGGAADGLAWIVTEGRVQTRIAGQTIDRVTTETMILRRSHAGWRIIHVHWSSRAAPTTP